MLTGAVTVTTKPRRGVHVLRRVLLAAVVLAMVLFGGGGWYFSGQIRSDGLEVTSYPVERNLVLTPEPGGRIAIRTDVSRELTMLQAPSTFGLKWQPDGYGRVSGPVVPQTGSSVVRRFEVVTGSAPPAGTKAEIDLVAFPEDPVYALGPDVATVTYSSSLGQFPAWFVAGTSPASTTWAILVHGKGASRTEMFRMARATSAAGLPSLDITYRNDEDQRRDPSGYYQYGRTEWRDLAAAVDYAGAHGAQRVVLGADSMGGGIVASYLRHRTPGSSAPPVAGLVLDAPMLDFGETVSFGARQLQVPVVGHLPESLTWAAKHIAALRYDIDWGALDYLSDTSWLTMPALVFHGTADTTVPVTTSRRLARERARLVTLVETKGVEHVRSWNADPQAYDARIATFVAGLTR